MQQGSDAGRAHRPAGRCARQPQAPRPQDSSTAVHFRENAVHFHEHAQASKPARLIAPITPKAKDEAAAELGNDEANSDTALVHRANMILEEVESSLKHFKLAGNGAP